MRRIVSVWLIDWPISVRRRSLERARRPASPPDPALDPANPFALILKNSRGAVVIHALNAAARRAGLRRGQTQADALAMVPRLIRQPADPANLRRKSADFAGTGRTCTVETPELCANWTVRRPVDRHRTGGVPPVSRVGVGSPRSARRQAQRMFAVTLDGMRTLRYLRRVRDRMRRAVEEGP